MHLPEPLPIATARTTLRRLSTDDVAAFQAYRTDPEVGRWQGWSPMSGSEALAFLARMRRAPLFVPGEWCQVGIALRSPADAEDEGRLIGDIGLGVDPADPGLAQVGFSMHRRWQGHGLAAEAVEAACALLFEHGGILVGIHANAMNAERVRRDRTYRKAADDAGLLVIEQGQHL